MVGCSANAGSTCKTEKCFSEKTCNLINKVGHTHFFFKSFDFIAKTLFVITWFCDHSVDFLDIFYAGLHALKNSRIFCFQVSFPWNLKTEAMKSQRLKKVTLVLCIYSYCVI